MIKTNQPETKSTEPHNGNRGGTCWNEDPQTQTIRVEFNSGNFFVFPYVHFISAEFTRTDEGNALKLIFSTHNVRIRGHHLRAVALAFQKLTVEWIKEVPDRYAALADANAALISSIEVSEVEYP